MKITKGSNLLTVHLVHLREVMAVREDDDGTKSQSDYLGVAELDLSRSFYEHLGWKHVNANADGIVFFQMGGMALALYPRVALAKDAHVSPDGFGFYGITLAYNTRTRDEVDAVLAQAAAVGAKLLKPAEEAFWGGYSGYFADPDGFLWEVAWNPFFPIADDGSIRIPTEV